MNTKEILQGIKDWAAPKVIYDISAAHNNTKYADLEAALGTNGGNIPQEYRKGGITVRYVQSSDNKYVQARLMTNYFSISPINWQVVDSEPKVNSKNLVESGGIINHLKKIENNIGYINISGQTSTGSINSTGGIREDSNALHTDFIKIDRTIKYFVISRLSNLWYAAFYSSNSEASFLSSLQYPNESNNAYNLELNIPDNAVYMRVTFYKVNSGLYTLRDINTELTQAESDIDKSEYKIVEIEDSIGYADDIKINVTTNSGRINSSGLIETDENALYTDYVLIDHNKRYAVESKLSNLWYAAFYSSNSESSFISSQRYISSPSTKYTLELEIPANAVYMRVTYYKVDSGLFIESLKDVDLEIEDLDARTSHNEDNISDILDSIGFETTKVATSTSIGSINSTGGIRVDENALYTDFVEIDHTKKYVVISLLSNMWYAAYYSSNSENSFISSQRYPNELITPYKLKLEIPANAVYMRVTYKANSSVSGLFVESLKEIDSQNIIYVNWDSGNDSNPGTINYPLKSITGALNICSDIKNNKIYIIGAHDYTFNDNELNINNKNIEFIAQSSASVRFKFGRQLNVSYNSQTGYYETTNVQFNTNTYLNFALYEDNVLDTETEILVSERHPLQRGKVYRMESVQYKQYTSSTIGSATRGFYYDGSKFIIKSTNELSSIWMPSTSFVQFINSQITIKDIDILYTSIQLLKCYFDAEDCRFMFGTSPIEGTINYRASQIKLVRCEVCGTLNSAVENSSNSGDGICGQSNGSVSYKTNQLSATLIDVWAHDNQDDGFSDHGRGVSTIIGGLYEYNRKGGVIPAQNCKSTIIGATSRRQQYGFSTVNVGDHSHPNEQYQGIECINCLSENNSIYGYLNKTTTSIMICRNCIASNEVVGYYGNGVNNMTMLYCCKAVQCQTKTNNTVNIFNGEDL